MTMKTSEKELVMRHIRDLGLVTDLGLSMETNEAAISKKIEEYYNFDNSTMFIYMLNEQFPSEQRRAAYICHYQKTFTAYLNIAAENAHKTKKSDKCKESAEEYQKRFWQQLALLAEFRSKSHNKK